MTKIPKKLTSIKLTSIKFWAYSNTFDAQMEMVVNFSVFLNLLVSIFPNGGCGL